jgi:predicted phosphodiesterase
MRIAAFSDTHGNLLALDAVLADIERQGPFDAYLMGGDIAAGGPRPAETLARIRDLACPVVLGNNDYYLFAPRADLDAAGVSAREREMLAWTRERLGPEDMAAIQALPRSYHLPGPEGGVRLVHANPHDLEEHIAPEEDEARLIARLAVVREPVLVFGHLHIAYQRRLPNLLLVDTGSAGFPRDGDRRAAWAEVWHDGIWQARHHRVPYDMDAVLADMAAGGMPNAEKRMKVLREARYKDRDSG